ncbi:unnamed protein product [Discula destructiva]
MAYVPKSNWHMALLHKSLGAALGTESQVFESKFGPQKSFRKTLTKEYKLRQGADPNWALWNIAAGTLEPRPSDKLDHLISDSNTILKSAHFAPHSFGKRLFRTIFGDKHHNPHLWGPGNGLMLPKALCYALNAWAVSIVPDMPDDPTPDEASRWASAPVKEWKWRVLDRDNRELRKRITRVSGDLRTGFDLDQKRLCFVEGCDQRPQVAYLYFSHCLGVLNRYRCLFRDPTDAFTWPAGDDQRKVDEAQVKRAREQLGWPPGASKPMADFWREVIKDVQLLNTAPHTVLDWRMTKSKYLPRASDAALPSDAPADKAVD